MIRFLLSAEDIEADLAELLLEKAEGIPFFIEEFTRSLEESGSLVKINSRCRLKPGFVPISIPGTLHDVLMARVDKLPEEAREVLQVGSVIEREFSWAMIKEVTGIPEMEHLSRLSLLKDAELIYEKVISPQLSYIFQHAMTRELLYNSLLVRKRRELHRAIGIAMERLYSDRLEEYCSMLALHFTRGEDAEKGYRYHHLAGDRAADSYANREAMNHFSEAWRLIEDMGKDDHESVEKRLDTAIKLAEVMESLGEFEATLGLLEKVLSDFSGKKDPQRYARVHYWMGNTFGNLGRYEDARKHLLSSLALAQAAGSKEIEGNAHNYLSQLDYLQGHLKRAMDHAEAAVQCQREIGKPFRLAWALIFKGFILREMKGVHDAREILEEAKVWVDRSGHDRARCLLLGLNSHSFLMSGQYEAAMKAALEGLELAEKIGEGIQKFFLLYWAAEAALGAGHGDSALNFIQRGISEGEKVGHPLGLAVLRLTLAKALLRGGRVEESMEPAEAALKFFQALDMGAFLRRALEIYAEILANWIPKDEMQIDKMMERAAALLERSSSPWHKIEHLGALARISLKRGRLANARKSLIEARSLYREVGLEDGTEELRSIEEALEKGEEKGGPGVR